MNHPFWGFSPYFWKHPNNYKLPNIAQFHKFHRIFGGSTTWSWKSKLGVKLSPRFGAACGTWHQRSPVNLQLTSKKGPKKLGKPPEIKMVLDHKWFYTKSMVCWVSPPSPAKKLGNLKLINKHNSQKHQNFSKFPCSKKKEKNWGGQTPGRHRAPGDSGDSLGGEFLGPVSNWEIE